MSVVFVGDVGTEIILDCGVSVASASVRTIKARSPSGVVKQWAASPEGTNSIKYATATGDIDRAGGWRLQAYVEMPGWSGHGEVVILTVKDLI